MDLFLSTLSQMAYLFSFIVLGFLLTKIGALPKDSAKVISKLENNLLLPAMVLNTFLNRFTVETLSTAWKTLLYSLVAALIAIFFAILSSRLITKDGYLRNIYTYGLSFSNFAFMGYAVVNALFPDIYFEYVIFTLPMWTCIYVWGTPELLIADGSKKSFGDRLKNFANPMFICMIIGIVLGLTGVGKFFPQWSLDLIRNTEACMSPLAMLLVGITLSFVDLKKTFTDFEIYIVSFLRLIVFPGVYLVLAKIFDFSGTNFLCTLCALAMPLGLSTIVIPAAYGRDTTKAASMALISHLLSCITIPIIFSLIK